MSDLLLQTKLFRPALRPSLISRSALIEQLNRGLGESAEGFGARMTLVCAPAGFGKTTLVTAWLAQLGDYSPSYSDAKAAWLSLDENDNDPVRFLTYVIAALQTAVPHIAETAVRYLQSPQPPDAESILTLLINEISLLKQSLFLVLDDYHVISTPAVHEALGFLVEHLPWQMHLLMATRSDPPLILPRLRAQGQLVELRAQDLRFSVEEASQFFEQVMNLTLTPEDTAALERRTEGWIAGLQLAAIALQSPLSKRGGDDQSLFIAKFTGSNRFILDYLTDEVLERRPKGTRNFLLQTSILDRLCGSLCDAVSGQSEGQNLLELLEQANLFLIPLDEERHWYRYHRLFADVLRRRLQVEQAEDLSELHRRAQEWFEQNGLLNEAVEHALAAGNFEEAARLIEAVHGVKWQSGELKSVQVWLEALPEEAWQTHPRLWLVQAWAAMTVGDFEDGDEKLKGAENALALLDESTAQTLYPEVLAFRASYASLTQAPQAVELAQQALRQLPEDYWLRGMLVVFLGGAYYAIGDLEAAADVLKQAPGYGSTQPASTAYPHQIHLLAFGSMVQLAQGHLKAAVTLVNQALALAEPGGNPIPYVGTLLAYMSASLIFYERNDLEQVVAILERCISLAAKFGSFEVHIFGLSGQVRAALAVGDLTAAEHYSDQVNILLQSHSFSDSIRSYVEYHHFLLLLKQNDFAAAAAWAESEVDQPGPLNPYAFRRLALPQILLQRGSFDLALVKLDRLILEAKRTGHGTMLIKALLLKAVVCEKMGQRSEALVILERAVLRAEPEGFIHPFVYEGEPLRLLLADFRSLLIEQQGPNELTRRLLAFTNLLLAAHPLSSRTAPELDPFIDPLSDRELEVLHLVAGGASNRDIAIDLFIAVPTVKKHISNIMSKLNAGSRTEAVAEARSLGLL